MLRQIAFDTYTDIVFHMDLYCKAGEQPKPILYYKAGDNGKRRKHRHDHTEDSKPDVEVRKSFISAPDDKPAEV